MSLVREFNTDGGGKILFWKIEESLSVLEKMYAEAFPLEEILPVHKQKRRQFLSARILCRLIEAESGIVKDAFGAPYLMEQKGYISISHTCEFSVVYFHPSRVVGIDIEKNSRKAFEIKDRFIHKEELIFFNQLQQWTPEKIATLLWSIKEAIYKWMHRENVHFRENILIKEINPDKKRIFTEINHPAMRVEATLGFEEWENHWLVYTL